MVDEWVFKMFAKKAWTIGRCAKTENKTKQWINFSLFFAIAKLQMRIKLVFAERKSSSLAICRIADML